MNIDVPFIGGVGVEHSFNETFIVEHPEQVLQYVLVDLLAVLCAPENLGYKGGHEAEIRLRGYERREGLIVILICPIVVLLCMLVVLFIAVELRGGEAINLVPKYLRYSIKFYFSGHL